MVSRNTDADVAHSAGNQRPVRRFFRWWQRSLTQLSAGVSSTLQRPRIHSRTTTSSRLRSAPMVWAGALALLVGATLGVVLSPPGGTRDAAILAAVMSVAWGPIRLLLMRVAATGDLASDATALRGAWGLGALAWLLGVTPELRALAWVVSGALTWLALERLGTGRRQARLCVGLAWGAQALVVVGSWLARNAIIAVLATRG